MELVPVTECGYRFGSLLGASGLERSNWCGRGRPRGLLYHVSPCTSYISTALQVLLSTSWLNNDSCTDYRFRVFGQFPAELGPETRAIGSGSKNGVGRTQN